MKSSASYITFKKGCTHPPSKIDKVDTDDN